MNHRLFWTLVGIIGAGVVALFYIIDIAISHIESDMSEIAPEYKSELNVLRNQAESIYVSGDIQALEAWLLQIQQTENTWAAIAEAKVKHIAGNPNRFDDYTGYNMGRSIDWQVHLYLDYNPIMELPFADGSTSLLVELPNRMRPGSYKNLVLIILQVILPMVILIVITLVLYRYIMYPIKQLKAATQAFSSGNFEVRVRSTLGKRDDELAQLSDTFDNMANQIGDLIIRQRQLITDLSHELRTPLTRLDIATDNLLSSGSQKKNTELDTRLERIHRESRHIRKLVDDTLTLSWLENEKPRLRNESLDLVDLLEVIIDDAKFEYPDRDIHCDFIEHAEVKNSNHRALGQAIENVLRNALRYTPPRKIVSITLSQQRAKFSIAISDQGPGVPAEYLEKIFRPFFRVDKSRHADSQSFGLGLALAQRQLHAVSATIQAKNLDTGGLNMQICVPAM